MPTPAPEPAKAWPVPDTLIIILGVAVLAALATYLIPAGSFVIDESSSGNISIEQFRWAGEASNPERLPVALFTAESTSTESGVLRFGPGGSDGSVGFFNFAFEGLVSGDRYGAAVGVVAFILIIGGTFGIVHRTGTIEVIVALLLKLSGGRGWLVIPLLFTFFSLGGAIFGMGIEAIAFAAILLPVIRAMGYDNFSAVMVTYCATQIGFATSWMNPFSVAVAQGISNVPVLSGAGFRVVVWSVYTLAGIIFTYRYAERVKRRHNTDAQERSTLPDPLTQARPGHYLIMVVFVLGLVSIIAGVVRHGFYIPEIASLFFAVGILAGIIGSICKLNNMTYNDAAESFRDGAANLISAAIIVGLAKGIVLLLGGNSLSEPSVLNTILYQIGSILQGLPELFSLWFMYLFQACFNFFVSSGTGQAALTMPLLAPIADIVGLTRQQAVLAFQLGDGLTNLIIPTSAALMGTLAVAKIELISWLKFQFRFQILLVSLSLITLAIAWLINF